jgi:lycopene cyclase domain-containing protein
MEKYMYLTILLFMLGLLLGVDYSLKLAFWRDRVRTARVLIAGLIVFIIWDILGVRFQIFYPGGSAYVTGRLLGAGFPVEEVFFLFNFCYVTLLLWLGGERFVHIHHS